MLHSTKDELETVNVTKEWIEKIEKLRKGKYIFT